MTDIKCPYCGAEDDACVSDLWEVEGDDNELECGSCEKQIIVNAQVSVTYDAKRTDCEDDSHVYSEWMETTIDQQTLNRWARDPIMSKYGNYNDEKPYKYFSRCCENCDDTDFSIHYEIGSTLEQNQIKSKYEVDI